MDVEHDNTNEELKRQATPHPSCVLTIPQLLGAEVGLFADCPNCKDDGVLCKVSKHPQTAQPTASSSVQFAIDHDQLAQRLAQRLAQTQTQKTERKSRRTGRDSRHVWKSVASVSPQRLLRCPFTGKVVTDFNKSTEGFHMCHIFKATLDFKYVNNLFAIARSEHSDWGIPDMEMILMINGMYSQQCPTTTMCLTIIWRMLTANPSARVQTKKQQVTQQVTV